MSTLIPTTASVTVTTTEGPLVIDLWAKETPKTSRTFLEHCIVGDYIGASIAVGDDAVTITSSVEGKQEESVADEFHSRLRFGTNGLLYTSQQSSGGQSLLKFHISSSDATSLQGKVNVFGRVSTESNKVLRLLSGTEAKVELVQVTKHYFDDLPQPPQAEVPKEVTTETKPAKRKIKMVYDEEEEDDTEAVQFKIKPLLVKKPKQELRAAEPKPEQKEKVESPEKVEEEKQQSKPVLNNANDAPKKKLSESSSKPGAKTKESSVEDKPKPQERLPFENPNKDLDLAEWGDVTDLSKHRFRPVRH